MSDALTAAVPLGRRLPLGWSLPLAALAVGALITLTIGMSTDGDPVAWVSASWTMSGAFALVATWRATRITIAVRRHAWVWLAAASGIWLIGQVFWDLFAIVGFPSSPHPGDLAWLAFAVAASGAFYGLLPSLSGGSKAGRMETLLLFVAVGSVMLAVFFGDLTSSELAWPARLTAVAYPVVYVSVPLIVAQILITGALRLRGRPDIGFVLLGLVCEAVAFALWAPPLLEGSYAAGSSVIDVLWALGMLALGAGALMAPTGDAADRHMVDDRLTRGVLPAIAFFGLLSSLIVAAISGASLGARLSLQFGVLIVGTILIAHFGMLLREQRRLVQEQLAAHEALRQARETSARFFLISRDMLCTVAPDGRITTVNPAWAETLGWSDEELLGRSAYDLVHPEDLEHTRVQIERVLSGIDVVDFDTRYRAKDGGWRWLSWQVRFSSEDEAVYGRATDITERRRASRKLGELNGELAAHARDLERSNADLQQFAYVASHDLSEPLRTVSNFAQLLDKRYGGELDERADRYIRHIVEGADRMSRLITDLLTYSRVGQGGAVDSGIDTGKAVADVLHAMRFTVEERGAAILVDDLPVIVADGTQIEQVFQNLLSNALKFCDAGRPEVRIQAHTGDDCWTFSVIDNGIGIEPRHAERIFQVFQRLHGRAHYEGTGIGLAVCKRAVEWHGGRIWAEPAGSSGGTRFSFTIPFPKAAIEVA